MNKAVLYLARRYAQAYLNVVRPELTTAAIEHLLMVIPRLKVRSEWAMFFAIPLIDKQQQNDFIQQLMAFYQLPSNMQLLLEQLSHDARMNLLPDVLEFIVMLYDQSQGIERFTAESSSDLSQAQIDSMKKMLEDHLHKKIFITTTINPALIAGISLSSKTHRFDYSVARLLNLLKRA